MGRYKLHQLRALMPEAKQAPKPEQPILHHFSAPPERKRGLGSMGGELTRFRVHLTNLETNQKQDVVVEADCVTHAIAEADKWACKNWPDKAVNFEIFRNPRPEGGYTYRG